MRRTDKYENAGTDAGSEPSFLMASRTFRLMNRSRRKPVTGSPRVLLSYRDVGDIEYRRSLNRQVVAYERRQLDRVRSRLAQRDGRSSVNGKELKECSLSDKTATRIER